MVSLLTLDDSFLKVVAMITGKMEVSDIVICSNRTSPQEVVFVWFTLVLKNMSTP